MILFEIKEYLENPQWLFVNVNSFERTWHTYWKQYHTATTCVLNASTKGLNPVFMPFMQLLRHSYELFLKGKCIEKGKMETIRCTHNVANLEEKAGIFNNMPLTLNDTQGDTFRYHVSREGKPHFTKFSMSLLEDCKNYFSYIEKKYSDTIRSNNTFRGRHYENRYVVYPSECTAFGVVSTGYDNALHILLGNIENQTVSVDDVLMPLLFMVRHSTELKLKQSLLEMGNVVSNSDLIYSEHSLRELWMELHQQLHNAIADLSDREFKDKSEKLYKDTEHFLNILNEKDANSYTFRYPETSSGNLSNFKPNKMIVMDYLKMMMATDSFLCFAVGVLAGTGTLQLGDDILYKMYN